MRLLSVRRAGVYSVKLAQGSAEMDRDFVLQWSAASGSLPGAAFFTERVDDQYYGLLMLVPPASQRAAETVPREIVFVVDTSGSMGGVSIKQAKGSLTRALRHLGPNDRFNVIEFNSSHRALFQHAVPASHHNLQLASEVCSSSGSVRRDGNDAGSATGPQVAWSAG